MIVISTRVILTVQLNDDIIFCRRFGESDADLSLEDKMFLRFQKERVKKARNISLFNLDGGDDVLTHKGDDKISNFFCDT